MSESTAGAAHLGGFPGTPPQSAPQQFDHWADGVRITVRAAPELADHANSFLGHFAGYGATLRNLAGFPIHVGFSPYIIQEIGAGAFTLLGADYRRNPLADTTPDLTLPLWIHGIQQRFRDATGTEMDPITPASVVSCQRGIVDTIIAGAAPPLYLERISGATKREDGTRLTGWMLANAGPATGAQADLVEVPAAALVSFAPYLAAPLMLPFDHFVMFSGGLIAGAWHLPPEGRRRLDSDPSLRGASMLEGLRLVGRPLFGAGAQVRPVQAVPIQPVQAVQAVPVQPVQAVPVQAVPVQAASTQDEPPPPDTPTTPTREKFTVTLFGQSFAGEADPQFRKEAEAIVGFIGNLHAGSIKDLGTFWGAFWWHSMHAVDGGYRVSQTNINADRDSANQWDLTPAARLRHEQTAIYRYLKDATWSPVNFNRTVRVAAGTDLTAPEIAMTRTQPDGDFGGWVVGSPAATDFELLRGRDLHRRNRNLAKYFVLPVGYSVVASGTRIGRLVDPSGTVRWTKK
ncbi:immunity protein Imm33 domain-containing protein [Occultella kanbiaonis]|uniref:immunity protein Imm33 domain-containing protein n=1 Tax=Occultella kanbiaonis TaxID=2675754 RepID=UPI0012B755B9|nr:hypothetical protein [Occultella kanbiaonis]